MRQNRCVERQQAAGQHRAHPEGTNTAGDRDTDPAAGPQQGFRSGFACFVGRPNVGKSTLINALVGSKIAITSARPQTTRHALRGVVHRPHAQLVVVDTPGLHRPRTPLGERLDGVARDTLSAVDVIGFLLPADEPAGRGDRYIAGQLAETAGKTPVVAIVTKTDTADDNQVLERLAQAAELGDWAEFVPVSAVSGFQMGVLTDELTRRLPEGSPLYSEGDLTDEPETRLIAEFVREAVLEDVRDELPHSVAVQVEELIPREDRELVEVYACVYVERQSQKAIVLGAGGSRLKEVGRRARTQIEALLGIKVYLDLHVKVAKEWQRDPKQLHRLGF